ncbi:MAG: hypothetical protein IKF82_05010 [Bacilli bacterium]|nr:hypothetical protein [Bacilli bacterium]MBR3209611.1 hypothetical protein [Bacilli bacterium]
MSGGRDYDDSFIKDIHYYGSYAGCCLEGIRPVIVIPFYSVPSILKNARRNKNGILEVEYGEYPQYAVDANLGEILEKEFLTGTLRKTGKTYTTYSRGSNEHDESFSPLKHEEFEYGGKKYVRVKLNNSFDQTLTNGVTIHPYDYV